jgi:alpha/beta superfamily hydrolase
MTASVSSAWRGESDLEAESPAIALPTQPITPFTSARLCSVDLAGPAGRLEALLNEGLPSAPFAALVCHPHPKGGGVMHNKVVYRTMKVLNDPSFGFAFPVLRFNFRGAGLSEGAHHGQLEIEDVQAAMAWLAAEYRRPLILAGFSFGAAMAIGACCAPSGTPSTGNVQALIALGLPIRAEGRSYTYRSLASCAVPKLFLSGDRDEYDPAQDLTQIAAAASEPKTLRFIPNADHFFTGQLIAMQQTLAAWLANELPRPHSTPLHPPSLGDQPAPKEFAP